MPSDVRHIRVFWRLKAQLHPMPLAGCFYASVCPWTEPPSTRKHGFSHTQSAERAEMHDAIGCTSYEGALTT